MTIGRLKEFSYARYTPLLFLKKQLSAMEEQSQKNVGGFMKGLLVKRLESSFFAFKQTLRRAIRSHERFLDMLDDGTVYISKRVSVYDLLDNDQIDVLDQLAEEDGDRVRKFSSDSFRPEFGEKIKEDLVLLRSIADDWQGVKEDPKLDAFKTVLEEDEALADRVLVFTESKETAEYLQENLNDIYPDKVMSYWSQGARCGGDSMSTAVARDRIQANFDPHSRKKNDDLRLLISTDVLAEGINLHRGNVVVNYDLPWNPARVLQRVGRVNRVGTEHEEIFIYNFFPTDQSEQQIGLEAAIKAKIQAFHDTLGEDAKYLTDEEEVSQQGYFGDRLYRQLNDAETYEGEVEEGPTELAYLQEIRTVRDENESLFSRVKHLPKKARLARKQDSGDDALLTFFRRDKLKKFFLADGSGARELTFFEAAEQFRAEPEDEAEQMPETFYDLLEKNKQVLDLLLAGEAPDLHRRKGRSNEQYILRRLKDKVVRRCRAFTEDDEELIAQAIRLFDEGVATKATAKKLKRALEKENDPLKVLALVRGHVPIKLLEAHQFHVQSSPRKEVILSEYFLRP